MIRSFARYDRVVDHYATMWPLLVPGYISILNTMQDIVTVLSDRPRRILDLGCGPGSATIAIAPACAPDGEVTLVDGSEAMVHAAKALLQDHVHATIVGDFTEPEVLQQVMVDDHFDLIVCSFALHHTPDSKKRDLITRMGDALRPNALLLLADEIAIERPAGWDIVERIRGRIVQEHLRAGRITPAFWEIETTLPAEHHLPFLPAKVSDLTRWMTFAGLAVSCPVSLLGSSLLLGIKAET